MADILEFEKVYDAIVDEGFRRARFRENFRRIFNEVFVEKDKKEEKKNG